MDSSDSGIATIQTKSRIGRGLAQRRTQKLDGSGSSFNQNNNVGNNNTNFRNDNIKKQDPFSNQNVLNLDDNTKSYNIGRANTDHMTEAQIDKQTANITKEIESLDYQLKNINGVNSNAPNPRGSRGFNNNINNNNNFSSNVNNDNNYGYSTFGSQNQGSSYTPSFESDANNTLGGTGRIRRNRENSVKKQQQITANSFNGRSTNTSLNAAFSSDKPLDHFEQQEKQLKQQLLEYEKKMQQQEKVMQLKENAKRNTQSKLNNQGQGDLTIKLSSPTFNNKKGQSITQNQKLQQDEKKQFNIYGDNSNEVSEYIPGSMGGGTQNKFRTTRGSFGGTQTLKKAPQPKNIDDEVAVATGFQDCPFEDSLQDNQELIQCPEGCGRQFNEKALQKHILVCKKVFQEKKAAAKKPPVASSNNRSVSSSKKNKPKASSNLADIKKKLKQQKEAQGGQKDDLIQE